MHIDPRKFLPSRAHVIFDASFRANLPVEVRARGALFFLLAGTDLSLEAFFLFLATSYLAAFLASRISESPFLPSEQKPLALS